MQVGVIGGGQLAWMMATAAQKLDIELVIQTPSQDDPAVAIATHTIFAAIDNAEATAHLAEICDVITFENEFVNLEALAPIEHQLRQKGAGFYPELRSLAPLLDKYHQRQYLQNLHLPTPRFAALTPTADLSQFGSQFGFPVVLKARRLGYDGRGTQIIPDLDSLNAVLGQPGQAADVWLLEEFVPFERELAVMAARSPQGEISLYPVVETQQVSQVCRRVFVTSVLQPEVVAQVKAIATQLLTHLNYVGIMGIEFFLTAAGKVLVNETAPRTHNSGHYSLDACETSQFEQQLRAVCGLPLGSAALTCAGAVMVNLLGYETAAHEYLEQRQQLEQIGRSHLHWYGKSVSRPGRKLGHVTVLLEDGQLEKGQAEAIAQHIEAIWYP
ncbi:MAG: 5-(carboxyamino)imidazole ribonucleotide synthase [Leptolyngbyaceae cyanobacterium CRU_2_3]|nr:5-(carboxyamino)imidazole ribonucleotide synthase [Leptolyngbyaceae cyanobacterium CRU_2_3]